VSDLNNIQELITDDSLVIPFDEFDEKEIQDAATEIA